MSTVSRWRGRPVLAVAVAVAVAAAPVAFALSSSRSMLVSPGTWGPVDFGDQVAYTLHGDQCADYGVHVEVSGASRPTASGPVSYPVIDLLHPGNCVGYVQVPSERAVRHTGWDSGDPIDITVVSHDDEVPLRYERIELEQGKAVAGTPKVVTPAVRDPRGGKRDKAMEMTSGDAVSIGRVDLSHIYSVSLRVCTTLPKPHVAPTFVELRADAPDGPSIVGPVDVNDDMVNAYKSNYGWPNCWQLQPWPISGKVPGRAPELFLAVTEAGGGPVDISYLDVNGTGAKVAEPPLNDPEGTQQLFNGKSFKGWDHSNCKLDEGAVRPKHNRDPQNYAAIATAGFVGESGCTMTYTRQKFHNAVIRLDYRMQDFGDNGAVLIGGQEVQLREAGEWLTGGLQGSTVPTALTEFATSDNGGGYPAQRVKSNSYPDWSRMEIVQVGSHYVVRVNGRTVTDCKDCAPDPGKFALKLESQPGFSYQYGVNGRFDSTFYPDVEDPADWGNLSFRNIRVYECKSPQDRVCVGGPGIDGRSLAPAASPAVSRSSDGANCSHDMTGGDWASYGQSLMGQQRQDAEKTITTGNVGNLAEVWRSDSKVVQSAPPIIADGCVFLNNGSAIEARDLRTGKLVWESKGINTGGTFAPTVVEGRVHLATDIDGKPRAVALDEQTGRVLWTSKPIYFGYIANQNSSAIVYDGIQVLFTTGPDNDPKAKQGYGLIDAATGKILYKSLTVPKSDRNKGLVGGGVWGTPTVDPQTGYAYVGTSNPESKQGESDYDDSIIKLDLNRDRKTFGRIVATYKGTRDSVTGYDNPVCQTVGGDLYYNTGTYGGSPTCGQIDVDFGVGPTLWRNSHGRLMGAATQKSGYLHVFYGDTMKAAWSKQLFVTMSFLGGNICRIATDGKTLYVVANPGVLYAFDAETGDTRWQAPLVSPIPMEGGNVVLSNGVLFFIGDGQAHAYDARDGSVLWDSSVVPGASIGSAGALAGHSYVANHYGTVIAYRLPAGTQ